MAQDQPAGFAGTLHLDTVGGIAGDMFAAALLDAFPGLWSQVQSDVAAILPEGLGATLSEVMRGSLRARHFTMHGAEAAPDVIQHYTDLDARIRQADLSPGTAERAAAILRALAGAEARVHGTTLERVHFHEVADWDSLMDVVAAGSIAAALGGARWQVSALPRGSGRVATQHGLLPAPAPATLELLEGFDFVDDGIAGERVTPTGAAILNVLVAPADRAPTPLGRLVATGFGAGTRDLPGIANVLRVSAFATDTAVDDDVIAVLEFDVDDMTGEEIATAAERLRQMAGVRDLSLGQIIGKKSRPACRFSLLVEPQALDAVAEGCFTQTSTIGLRHRTERRRVLARQERGRAKIVERSGDLTAKADADGLRAETLSGRRAEAAAIERDVAGGGDDS
ncbi:LarC family nickel insertion protein [Tropicimonas sp. IMCC34011]|uniref:LarC family nickel insertion protein n=1 Tax=Tropicimonas sp. IMCC34011 TaxID=2248759 RepID=UPI000E26A801|nr:LarC family nickel insertion protein [Tropicimonas sp. IMCC34011]